LLGFGNDIKEVENATFKNARVPQRRCFAFAPRRVHYPLNLQHKSQNGRLAQPNLPAAIISATLPNNK